MSRRSKAREVVVQMLYQLDVNPDVPMDIVRDQVWERMEDEPLARFAWQLLSGVLRDKSRLDASIEALAANWSLKRMAPTDRNVLRLGAYELSETETPPGVVIDEAVELAKRFGAAQSPQFVNGILDRLIPPGRKAAAVPAAPSATSSLLAEPEDGAANAEEDEDEE
jgi:transcription antitermination protein NusB